MNLKDLKYELQFIISGKSSFSQDSIIQTISNQLRTGQRASPMAEKKHQNKSEETKSLIRLI